MARSKEWANDLLRSGIRELKNKGRDRKARFLEVITYIGLLMEEGFWWQAERLRNHLHRHWRHLQDPSGDPDPPGGEEEPS